MQARGDPRYHRQTRVGTLRWIDLDLCLIREGRRPISFDGRVRPDNGALCQLPNTGFRANSGPTITVRAQDAPKLPQFGPKSVVAAIEQIKQGKIIVVTDDEDRENEGDLIMAAEFATPETIGFIRRYSSGVICVAVRLPRMLPPSTRARGDAGWHAAGGGLAAG